MTCYAPNNEPCPIDNYGTENAQLPSQTVPFPCNEDEAFLLSGICKPTDDLTSADVVVRTWNCALDGNMPCGPVEIADAAVLVWEPSPTVLAHTGSDSLLGSLGLCCAVFGVALRRIARHLQEGVDIG